MFNGVTVGTMKKKDYIMADVKIQCSSGAVKNCVR